MDGIDRQPVDKWIIDPMKRFFSNSITSGILLFTSAILAMIISNSPWSEQFHHFWEINFSIGFGSYQLSKSIHHWINDGLMAVFFFVVGLELKREIIAGELRDVRKAMLPIAAALGGMIVPAIIYFAINREGEPSNGWGIPMATDIAFALGVLYLLGDRVPISLKIFLTALAITDDLGAVLVIAFFYTSEINFMSLLLGGLFLLVLFIANRTGVRNTLFYAILGIGGLWLAFLLSGVHATIAAVLLAFTIPANVKVSENFFNEKLQHLLSAFKEAKPNNLPTVTNEQLHLLEEIKHLSDHATTPLQKLEHSLHPFVSFIIMPVFAFSNAGVTLSGDVWAHLLSPISLGVFFGLLIGKVVGVLGMVGIFVKFKLAELPKEITRQHLVGAGFLAAIGFTMSLFVAGLAFENETYITEAKLGILAASLVASIIGYTIIRKAS